MVSIFASIVLSVFSSAHAYIDAAKMPVCLDNGQELQLNNAEILNLKRTSRNQTHARAFVEGKVTQVDWRKNDHDHFIISIGPGKDDTLEIIYNDDHEFGPMGEIQVGDTIVVCGDYITSTARARGYDASPVGAIVHWVHYNPGDRGLEHEHGFLMLRGDRLVGFDKASPSAWDGRVTRQNPSAKRKKRDQMDGESCDSELECEVAY